MDNVVRGGNWYFDLLNTFRVLDEVELPEIKRAADGFVPSGHIMGVEWPEEFEALKATVKTKTSDPQIRGLCGREPGHWITSTYYENLANYRTGETKGRVIVLKGLINEAKQDSTKGLKMAGANYVFSTVVFYHDIVDGRSIHKFDYFAGPGATLINGERLFAGMAQNLAIGGGTVL